MRESPAFINHCYDKKRLAYYEQVCRTFWSILLFSESLSQCYNRNDTHDTTGRVIKTAIEGIRKILPCRFIAYYSLDQASMEFHQHTIIPLESAEECSEVVDVLIDKGLFAWGIKKRKCMVFKNNVNTSFMEEESILFAPVSTGLNILGVVIISSLPAGESISRETFSLLELIFRQVAFILENLHLVQKLKKEQNRLESAYRSAEEKARESSSELALLKEKSAESERTCITDLTETGGEIGAPLAEIIHLTEHLLTTALDTSQRRSLQMIRENAGLLLHIVGEGTGFAETDAPGSGKELLREEDPSSGDGILPLPFDIDDLMDRMGSTRETACEIMDGFLAEMPKVLETFRDALRNNDAVEIQVQGHRLKGSALNISAQPLSHIASMLEEAGRKNNLKEAHTLLSELEEEAERLRIFVYRHSPSFPLP